MEFWPLAAVLILASVAGFVIIRRRRTVTPAPRYPTEIYLTMPYRVSWPPGYANDRPIRQVKNPEGRYLIESFESRSDALEFLRGCEVRDERVYVIAETPQGNLGKDLIMIFEERDGAFVEIAERGALPAPEFSRVDCGRCGYSVIPGDLRLRDASSDQPARTHILDLESMERSGLGFQCTSCLALGCARCYRATLSVRTSSGMDLRCWLCSGEVAFFVE